MTMTETRQEVVTEADKTGDRPFMKRLSPSEILRDSMRMSPESINALRSVWSELSADLIAAREGDLKVANHLCVKVRLRV